MTRTKIVATAGPSCSTPDTLTELITAGVNVIRLNLKHNTHEWHGGIIDTVKAIASEKKFAVSMLADVPGIERLEEMLPIVSRDDVNFVALSYVRSSEDVKKLREKLSEKNSKAKIIVKIETVEALNHTEELIRMSDGIMVARGDLGVELSLEQVPYHQKHIIRRCLEIGKPVITATQMLESMIQAPTPTRAEVSDVANALYDCTDAVMLSAETAIGKYPKEAVQMMKKIIEYTDEKRPLPGYNYEVHTQTQALTMAANDLAKFKLHETLTIKAFVIITETGESAYELARHRPLIPIIAVTMHENVYKQLLLVWGVTPIFYQNGTNQEIQIDEIREQIKDTHLLSIGDNAIMIYSSEQGKPGSTNIIRIQTI